jgi:2-polyprenyl-3-methyl-5-hydroxy-6-metoxy-1,4-benzoquinol methylase
MATVELVVAWSETHRESAEFRALQDWVRAQAERVWDRVVSVGELARAGGDAPLLVVGDRCLVGSRSLGRMRGELEGGAAAVTPTRLGRSGLPGLETVRTLSGIETAESQVLAAETPPGGAEEPPFAALLVAARAVAGLRGLPAVEALADARLAARTVTAGLCHEFIDYYGEVREDVLPFVDPSVREVLEVGCGSGGTGALLQERLGCRVTGVELNPVAARAAARRLQRVIVGDVLEVDPGGPYDALVACELFEHLTRQDLFLRKVRTWLRPGGRAVLSVPNVGHHAIVQDLLAGRWDYLPIGLICHTHYRFFTRRTLEDWCRAAGFAAVEIVPQTTEPPPWLKALPPTLDVDAESLRTSGFYVLLET